MLISIIQMAERKKQLIQMGEYFKARSPIKAGEGQIRSINNTYYLREGGRGERICSKELITSSHRISLKVSPSKKRYPHQQQNTNRTALKNQKSFTDLDNSSISIINQHINETLSPRIYKTAHLPDQTKQFIKVSFVSKSPAGSKTSSTHIREIKPSPKKVVQLSQSIPENCQNNELERKVRILEDRITELHRQKHDALAKMNEENRKVYHQNTTLKLKISQLQNLLEKAIQKQPKIGQTDPSKDSGPSLGLTSYLNCQINRLKDQIQQLEQSLQVQIKKSLDLLQDNQRYEQLLREKCQMTVRQQTQIDSLAQQSKRAAQANQQLKRENRSLQAQKEEYQRDLIVIKSNLSQYSDRNQTIYKEYEQKISHLKSQCLECQTKCDELTGELIGLQNDKMELIQIRQDLESKLSQLQSKDGISLEEEIKRYEASLNQAIIKEQEIEGLRSELRASLDCLAEANHQLVLVKEENQFRNKKITEISHALIKYQQKYKDIEQKYSELANRFDPDKTNQSKSQTNFNDRSCKKCDDLLKTIFRLNNHLNSTAKKSA